MTVTTSGRKATSACNGVTVTFGVPFQFQAGGLRVFLLEADSGGEAALLDNSAGTELTEGVDFTISGDGASGTAEITTGTAYPAGRYIRRWRDTTRAQTADYTPNDGFPALTHESQLDRLSMVTEELSDDTARLDARAIKMPGGETAPTLPGKAARGNKLLGFSADGEEFVMATGSGADSALRGDLASLLAGTMLLAVALGLSGQEPLDLSDYLLSSTPAPIELFGGVGDGASGSPTDNGPKLVAAFAAARHVRLRPGQRYRISSTATFAGDDRVLEVPAGATLEVFDDGKGINPTGARFTVTGAGRILGPDDAFDGSIPVAAPNKALIFFEGDHGSVFDVELFNIPRIGVCFNDCIPGAVRGVRFIGNFPYATAGISTHALTGQIGLEINPPASGGTTTPEGNYTLQVSGCRFETCIQGIHGGTYVGGRVRLQSTGNTFSQCWDHGIYIQLGDTCTSTGDIFVNCALPIVFDRITGGAISGFVMRSDETSRINADQIMDIRDCSGLEIGPGTIEGRGAAIDIRCLTSGSTAKLNRIKVRGVNLNRTGAAVWASPTPFLIRFIDAEEMEDCEVSGCTFTGSGFSSAQAAVQMSMAGANLGQRNRVTDNRIVVSHALALNDLWPVVFADNQRGFQLKDNLVRVSATAAAAATLVFGLFTDTDGLAEGNRIEFVGAGTNLLRRGFQCDGTFTALEYAGNRMQLAAGAGTLDYFPVNAGSPRIRRNALEGAEPRGTVTIANGAASGNHANACALAAHSRVAGLVPQTDDAAALMASVGVYPTVTDGQVAAATGDGSTAPADCLFAYELA